MPSCCVTGSFDFKSFPPAMILADPATDAFNPYPTLPN